MEQDYPRRLEAGRRLFISSEYGGYVLTELGRKIAYAEKRLAVAGDWDEVCRLQSALDSFRQMQQVLDLRQVYSKEEEQ